MALAWNHATGEACMVLTRSAGVLDLEYSSDGTTIATASSDNTIKLWETKSGGPRISLVGSDAFRLLSFNPSSSHLATATEDTETALWDVHSASCGAVLYDDSPVVALQFMPEGERLFAACADGLTSVRGVNDAEEIMSLRVDSETTCLSPTGTLIAATGASDDYEVAQWGASEGHRAITLAGHTDTVTKIRFSSDGTSMVTVSDVGTIRF
ncbi:WD40 repeat-like protein [Obba rivulosa]|uniref:WD40 repeat-like protein n=1 Tax=Obba rivulosa TaxID=1052685 RepID=A0A8E2ARI7_9APHY|nr:WD40 repeat-like protein [Obba rivulosa]